MPGFFQYLNGTLVDTYGMTHTTAWAVEVIAAVVLVAVALWIVKKATHSLRR